MHIGEEKRNICEENPIFDFKVTISRLILSPSASKVKNIEVHKNLIGVYFEKKSLTAIVLEQRAKTPFSDFKVAISFILLGV